MTANGKFGGPLRVGKSPCRRQLLKILAIGFGITKVSIQHPVTACPAVPIFASIPFPATRVLTIAPRSACYLPNVPGPGDQKFSAIAYRAASSLTSLGPQANEGCTGFRLSTNLPSPPSPLLQSQFDSFPHPLSQFVHPVCRHAAVPKYQAVIRRLGAWQAKSRQRPKYQTESPTDTADVDVCHGHVQSCGQVHAARAPRDRHQPM